MRLGLDSGLRIQLGPRSDQSKKKFLIIKALGLFPRPGKPKKAVPGLNGVSRALKNQHLRLCQSFPAARR